MYKPIYPSGRGNMKNNLWESYSFKANRIVKMFSDLEYDHWLLVENNPDIVTFCEQPCKVTLLDSGKKFETIFDMWVRTKNGEQRFIEVKYQKDLDPANPKSARSIRQTRIQRNWCEENQMNYSIMTENEIRQNEVLLANCRTILPFIKNREHHLDLNRQRILRLLRGGRVSIMEIHNRLGHLNITVICETICWLIYSGEIESNFDKVPFGLRTEVWTNV